MMQCRIREASESDLEGLEWWGWFTPHRSIIRDVFEGTRRGETLMLIADSGGFPIGQLWVDLKRKAKEGVAILWAIRIIPGFRGVGVGAELILAAEEKVRERGYLVCEIGVEPENTDARRLYQKMGYRMAGEERDERDFVGPDGSIQKLITEQHIMRKKLN